VIYAQNWKVLLGSAAKTMALVILGLIGITLVLFAALGLLFRLFDGPGWVAFGMALLIAFAIKSAFIDSFILARTMVAYMSVAPTTVITFDLYGKLCGISNKFKELFNKGQQEQPTPAPAYAGASATNAQPTPQPGFAQSPPAPQPTTSAPPTAGASSAEKPIFCGQCGAKNKRGVKFCGSCGAKL
jgi:hypothetical protein